MSDKDCPVCGFKGGRTRGDIVLTLQGEINHLRAERDALLPVVEAAKAWRSSGAYFGSGNANPERLLAAAVDALQPTEGAQS